MLTDAGRTTDGRRTDDGVTGILIAHLGAFGSGELKSYSENLILMKKVNKQCLLDTPRTVRVSEKTWQVIVRTRRP